MAAIVSSDTNPANILYQGKWGAPAAHYCFALSTGGLEETFPMELEDLVC